jgi:hypothetical protein
LHVLRRHPLGTSARCVSASLPRAFGLRPRFNGMPQSGAGLDAVEIKRILAGSDKDAFEPARM